jgi:hypothetical protein
MGGIERGEHNLTMNTVLTISKGLGITMSELLAGMEKETETAGKPPKPKKG